MLWGIATLVGVCVVIFALVCYVAILILPKDDEWLLRQQSDIPVATDPEEVRVVEFFAEDAS